MRLKAHLLIFSSAHCPSDGHYPSPQFLPRCSHRDAFVEQDSSVEPLLLDLPGCPSAAAALEAAHELELARWFSAGSPFLRPRLRADCGCLGWE